MIRCTDAWTRCNESCTLCCFQLLTLLHGWGQDGYWRLETTILPSGEGECVCVRQRALTSIAHLQEQHILCMWHSMYSGSSVVRALGSQAWTLHDFDFQWLLIFLLFTTYKCVYFQLCKKRGHDCVWNHHLDLGEADLKISYLRKGAGDLQCHLLWLVQYSGTLVLDWKRKLWRGVVS